MGHRRKKGEYGYREYRRKVQVGEVLFGAVMILVQLGARQFTDSQAVKNVLTVMAILSVLPTANVASPLLAAWRYKTPPRSFLERVQVYESKFPVLYDLILTSKEAIMPVDAAAVHPTGVYLYCTSRKVDAKKAEKFLNDMFAAHHLDPHVRMIQEEKAFFQRLESSKPASEYEDDGSTQYTLELLKQLSM